MPKFQRAMPVARVTRPKAAPATRAAPATCLTRRAPAAEKLFRKSCPPRYLSRPQPARARSL